MSLRCWSSRSARCYSGRALLPFRRIQQGSTASRMEITDLKTVHTGWAKFLIASVRLADGRSFRREIEDHGAAACVLPYDAERRMAGLVRQLRGAVFFFLAGAPKPEG